MNIKELTAEIERLISLRAALINEERQKHSKAVIAALGITKADVIRSSEDEMPYFGHSTQFGEWLEKNKINKRFCEWNGCLYHTAALCKGLMIEVGCQYDDVP